MSALFPLMVRGAVTKRRGKALVGPVDMEWDGQGTRVLIGPNGAGKTTLLRLLHGLARLHGGQITWACPQAEAQSAQAFVFQRPIMLRRNVRDNLIYPLRLRGVQMKDAQQQSDLWAEKVGLTDHLARPATRLSGGEQQKLAIARALIAGPQVVFLDEPTVSLDGRATREIEQILQDASATGTRFVLATHDLGQARRLAHDVCFMLRGSVHETAPAEAFFAGPQTTAAAAFLKGDIVE